MKTSLTTLGLIAVVIVIAYLAIEDSGEAEGFQGKIVPVITVEYVDGTTDTFYPSMLNKSLTLYYPATGGEAVYKIFQKFEIVAEAGNLGGTWWCEGMVLANRGTTNVDWTTEASPRNFGTAYLTPASCLKASDFSSATTGTYTIDVAVSGTVHTTADVSNPDVGFQSSTSYSAYWTNHVMTVTVTPQNPTTIGAL